MMKLLCVLMFTYSSNKEKDIKANAILRVQFHEVPLWIHNTVVYTSFVLFFFNSGFRSWKTHHQMNKYVLNQNTTLMCTHDFCYFLVFILGIWGAKKGVFAHNHNTEIFSPFNIIFILNFHSLKILPLFAWHIHVAWVHSVLSHTYAGAHYSINL